MELFLKQSKIFFWIKKNLLNSRIKIRSLLVLYEKIFILTGEASGDKLASTVISKLNQYNDRIDYLLLEDQIFLD